MSLATWGERAIANPVTRISTICIPNSRRFQNPVYQPSMTVIGAAPTTTMESDPQINVSMIANTKESGISRLNIATKFSARGFAIGLQSRRSVLRRLRYSPQGFPFSLQPDNS